MLHADDSITGADVRRIVARVIGRRGAPSRIRSDNGSEFICEALVNWLPGVGAASIPVAAGSPWENGYIESFHSRLRDVFLEREEFEDVADARAKATLYRRECNAVRPHSSLGDVTPKEFSAACDQRGTNQDIYARGSDRIWILAEDSHFKWNKKWGAAQPPGAFKDWSEAAQAGVNLLRWWTDRLGGTEAPALFTWPELAAQALGTDPDRSGPRGWPRALRDS